MSLFVLHHVTQLLILQLKCICLWVTLFENDQKCLILNFSISAISINFWPKVDPCVNTIFTRNVEWDFLYDFQTLCDLFDGWKIIKITKKCLTSLHDIFYRRQFSFWIYYKTWTLWASFCDVKLMRWREGSWDSLPPQNDEKPIKYLVFQT